MRCNKLREEVSHQRELEVKTSLLGAQGITGLNVYSMIAIIGSVVVLWGYHAVTGR